MGCNVVVNMIVSEDRISPPPPCASTGLSKHAVGVELLFSGFFCDCCFLGP